MARSSAVRPALKTIESILDLAPKHTGPGAVGFAGGWGSQIHTVPELTPSIRSTVGQIAERHAPNDTAVIGKSPEHIRQNHQSFGPGPDHDVINHPNEKAFMSHMAGDLGYDNPAHMATELSTPQQGGAPLMPPPQMKKRGGRVKTKAVPDTDDEDDE